MDHISVNDIVEVSYYGNWKKAQIIDIELVEPDGEDQYEVLILSEREIRMLKREQMRECTPEFSDGNTVYIAGDLITGSSCLTGVVKGYYRRRDLYRIQLMDHSLILPVHAEDVFGTAVAAQEQQRVLNRYFMRADATADLNSRLDSLTNDGLRDLIRKAERMLNDNGQ